MMDACPETDAHSPEELRKAMLMLGSEASSSVLPDSVLVWKRRSMPPFSYYLATSSVPLDMHETARLEVYERFRVSERTFAANAIHLEVICPVDESLVVIIPNLQESMKMLRSSTFSLILTWSMFFSL